MCEKVTERIVRLAKVKKISNRRSEERDSSVGGLPRCWRKRRIPTSPNLL